MEAATDKLINFRTDNDPDVIRTIIIDDEISSIEVLKHKVTRHCPDVEIIASFQDPAEAYKYLQTSTCDLIFLDIEMPGMIGFELLGELGIRKEKVIFITTYDQFAIQAVKCSALDYLLKPVDTEELRAAIKKVEKEDDNSFNERLMFLLENFKHSDKDSGKIAIATSEGIEILNISEVLYLAAESNYTKFYLEDGSTLFTSKTLKHYEEFLVNYGFFKPHHKFLTPPGKIKIWSRQTEAALFLTMAQVYQSPSVERSMS